LASKTVEGSSNVGLPLILLPFFGNGFVPTDSMPVVLRWFAEYQPFTPFISALRGLLMGTPIGNDGYLALAWCLVIGFGGFLWSKKLFNRESTR
jgi:ABC-2 type transport system permease protein